MGNKKKKKKLIEGVLDKKPKGFGFVKVEGKDEDIFIPKHSIKDAMNGDLVQVDLLPEYLSPKRREGIIVKVIDRSLTKVIGTLQINKSFGFVVPDNRKNPDDIFIEKSKLNGAKDGDKVIAEIIRYPEKDNRAEGEIIEIISKGNDPKAYVSSLIREYGLIDKFSENVNNEALFISQENIKNEIKGRLDLRNKNIFTIDGKDAKDLDDAVSVEILKNGNYLLGVHIADVSHYVRENSFLDKEAVLRGNSVYLINRVIPMLPKALSNGACSLNPNEDKLTLSCIMEIDNEGNMVNYSVKKTVICSKQRLVYDNVSDFLEGFENKGTESLKPDVKYDLIIMKELAEILRNKRIKNGSLDFELPEAEIVLDKNEYPISIKVKERRVAEKLIEEFMLIANETVSESFFWMDVPFIYRVHEKPNRESLEELKLYLINFGVRLKGSLDNITPKTLASIMEEIKDKPYADIINNKILRTMTKAYYSGQCLGHFGLAMKYYSHFTSPIRRYPDLMIHRIIKKVLDNEMDLDEINRLKSITEKISDSSSKTERLAQDLERDVEKYKKAQFMVKYIGSEFNGIVSGVTDFGVYVELDNTVEGMAFKRDLKKEHNLGEKVRIRVVNSKPEEREIDFEILE